jgi:hypothetical protein
MDRPGAEADRVVMSARPTRRRSVVLHHVRRREAPPASSRVSVVVADDHLLFRAGIERAIRERAELELVGSAADGPEALSCCT